MVDDRVRTQLTGRDNGIMVNLPVQGNPTYRTPQDYGQSIINFVVNIHPEVNIQNMIIYLGEQISELDIISDDGIVSSNLAFLCAHLYGSSPNIQDVQNYINQILAGARGVEGHNIEVFALTDMIVDQDSIDDIYTKSLFNFNEVKNENLLLTFDFSDNLSKSYSLFINSFLSIFGDL